MRDLVPPYAIQYELRGEGTLTEPELRGAVAAAARCHPGARLRRAGRYWVDSGVAPPVRVVAGHRLPDTVLDSDPLLRQPVGGSLSGEATVEVVLLPGPPITLLFRAFHGVMDGAGLGMWMSDVFRALRGERPLGAPDATNDEELVARLGARGTPTPLVPLFRSPVGHGVPASGQPAYLTRARVIESAPAAVVARVAAILAAKSASTSRFMVPVDLRRHDSALRSTANLSLPLFLDVEPGQRWWEVNARLLNGLLERAELDEMSSTGLSTPPDLVSRTMQRLMGQLGARLGRNLVSGLISHVGRFRSAELSGAGFAARSLRVLPVHTLMIPLGVFMVETEAGVSVSVSVRNGPGVPDRVEALLDELGAELGRAGVAAPAPRAPSPPAGGPPAVAGPDLPDLGDATAVSVFRSLVRQAPDAVAVRGPEGAVRYRELAAHAERIAAELVTRGAGAGEVVAVIAGRTPRAVAAQWGVLFGGAAFLPLDPAHPPARVRAILRRAGVRHCLVERAHVALVGDAADVLVLEEIPDTAPDSPVQAVVAPGDVAYVTYTSGSTGEPKGVEVTHRGIASWAHSALRWYGLGPGRAFCHHHTPAADLACIAFFGAHLSGAALVLVPEELDHLAIRRMLTESGADTVLFTPSLARVVVDLAFTPAPMRTVILAGEQLDRRLAAAVRRFFGPDTTLVNSYGPAELTLVCTNHVIDDAADDESGAVPIGTPSAGTSVYLFDAEERPVRPGECGEMYIGGPQVARGYLNAPEATAARFLTLEDGCRVYRTGDSAVLAPDGRLVFVGRVDDQIKIRGFRVEPEEVRAAVETHPGVRHAAVVARRRGEGDVLTAFVVSDIDIGAGELREFLAARLPAHMIPALVRRVDALPRNANGKLDRAALALEDDQGADDQAASATTATGAPSVAERVTAIWCEALGVAPASLGPDADFFDHGGDSLSAVRMLADVAGLTGGADASFLTTVRAGPLTLGRVCEAVRCASP
ncbi:non-ribosomal peptide synthetase [Nocardia farcinica]|uniref:non-ribosomal peptide synthetase n=1 Tax=Nocardia farcinica TaxID=37329 RepID=UPI002458C699|nr:non-ribosomal peptide synthetase [Nocardia farcinica]